MDKVLAVDDEKDILFTLEAIAEVAKFNIVTADHGLDALKILKNDDISLVMVDYHMPDINGMELVKRIREKYLDIPVLVLTVDESVELANKFIEAGATDFAIKPIKTADLISRINLHLEMAKVKATSASDLDNIDLAKGMTRTTLKVIVNYLKEGVSPETIDQISEGTGLAYQTVHRYLNFLAKINYVDVELEYGKVGRPIHRYLLK